MSNRKGASTPLIQRDGEAVGATYSSIECRVKRLRSKGSQPDDERSLVVCLSIGDPAGDHDHCVSARASCKETGPSNPRRTTSTHINVVEPTGRSECSCHRRSAGSVG
jgi:hypothetical protein